MRAHDHTVHQDGTDRQQAVESGVGPRLAAAARKASPRVRAGHCSDAVPATALAPAQNARSTIVFAVFSSCDEARTVGARLDRLVVPVLSSRLNPLEPEETSMATLLMLTIDMHASAEILPALELLPIR